MEQIGIITKTDGDKALVQIKRGTACGGECGKCSGCETTEQQVEALNAIGAQKGQLVKIEMQDSHILLAAFLVYIVPLIMLFIGYIIGYSLFTSELIGVISGFILLIVSFIILKIVDKIFFSNAKNQKSLITKIIN